jgi:hypothetical protein
MARELKVYGTLLVASPEEQEALGQNSRQRQIRAIVATRTKKEACEKLGLSASEARGFLAETFNPEETDMAMSEPGQVFATQSHVKKYFIKIERRPHVPVKRTKRLSFAEQMKIREKNRAEREARAFTREELEYMVDLFSSANNPLAASIAERARLTLDHLNARSE